ncbi:hypothetical protein Tco_0930301, partial [Tanacetum coccineum]
MERYRNLRIVLSVEDKLPFLEQPIPVIPVPAVGQVIPQDVHNSHTAWVKALKEIIGLMLTIRVMQLKLLENFTCVFLVDGFVNRFEKDNSIFVSKNNLIYFNAIPRDDIYEIVMSSSNTNDSLMFAISNKRA